MPKSDPHFVLVPHSFLDLGETEGVKDVTAYNPAMTTDEILKMEYGFPLMKRTTSTIISMNRIRMPPWGHSPTDDR